VKASLKFAGRSWITRYKEQAVTKSKSAAICQLSSGSRKNNKKSQALMYEAEGCIKKERSRTAFHCR